MSLLYSGISNLTISGKTFTDLTENAITIENCSNIKITACSFTNITGEAIRIKSGSSNITVHQCLFDTVRTGVYATDSSNIRVTYSTCKNVQGPKPRGQFVQLNACSGSNNYIAYNVIINRLGESNPEDLINLFKTNGTAEGYVLVEYNYAIGGGPSASGGGFLAGDNGGSYQQISNNILVDPGQYGIACAGGDNIILSNNQVYGKQQYFTNVGMYVWNQSDFPSDNVQVLNNIVGYTNSAGVSNGFYNGSNDGVNFNTTNLVVSGNNFNATYTIPKIPSGWGASLEIISPLNKMSNFTGIWNGNLSTADVLGIIIDSGLLNSIQLEDGTAAAPSLTFINDTNTGMYRIGDDTIGFSLGGISVVDMSNSRTELSNPIRINYRDGTATNPQLIVQRSDNGVSGLRLAVVDYSGSGFPVGYASANDGNIEADSGSAALHLTTNGNRGACVHNSGTGDCQFNLFYNNGAGFDEAVILTTQGSASGEGKIRVNSENNAALPDYSFIGDTTTGIYQASSGVIGMSGALIGGVTSSSGPGAVALTGQIHEITTTGTGDALTLANGTAGQMLRIIYVAESAGSDTAVLTPTTLAGGSTITFNTLGDGVSLVYSTTGGWHVVGINGAVVA